MVDKSIKGTPRGVNGRSVKRLSAASNGVSSAVPREWNDVRDEKVKKGMEEYVDSLCMAIHRLELAGHTTQVRRSSP